MTEADQYAASQVVKATMTSRAAVDSVLRKSARTHFLPQIPSMTYQYRIGLLDLNLLAARWSACRWDPPLSGQQAVQGAGGRSPGGTCQLMGCTKKHPVS